MLFFILPIALASQLFVFSPGLISVIHPSTGRLKSIESPKILPAVWGLPQVAGKFIVINENDQQLVIDTENNSILSALKLLDHKSPTSSVFATKGDWISFYRTVDSSVVLSDVQSSTRSQYSISGVQHLVWAETSDMDSSMGADCTMDMTLGFHDDLCFLSSDWRLSTPGDFAGACFFVIVLCFIREFVSRFREYQQQRTAHVHPSWIQSPKSPKSPIGNLARLQLEHGGYGSIQEATRPLLKNSCTVRLSVHGMTCGMCAKVCQHCLLDIHGVTAADVQWPEGIANISYESSLTSVQSITDAISSQGFAVTQPEDQLLYFEVNGMTCSACEATIGGALHALPFVRQAQVSHSGKCAMVAVSNDGLPVAAASGSGSGSGSGSSSSSGSGSGSGAAHESREQVRGRMIREVVEAIEGVGYEAKVAQLPPAHTDRPPAPTLLLVIDSSLFAVLTALAYLLMLVVMTYDYRLCITMLLALSLGHLLAACLASSRYFGAQIGAPAEADHCCDK